LMSRTAVKWVFNFKENQDCGRERQHVTGETHSSFAARAEGIAKNALAAKTSSVIEVSAN
jgi:glutathione S-transferase